MLRWLCTLSLIIVLAGCGLGVAAAGSAGPLQEADDEARYDLTYEATLDPGEGTALVRLVVGQQEALLEWLDLNVPAGRYSAFEGDGRITKGNNRVRWQVPATGGELRYVVDVNHRRGERFDARLTEEWALLRLDDLFPPARVSTRLRERSNSRLVIRVPKGWSVETPFGGREGRAMSVPDSAMRRFVRPTGWMVAGKLGTRRARLGDRQVVISAPVGQNVRRMPWLTFVRWTLPDLVATFPGFPERVLIVSADDEMWRGGLSGPRSLYLHADRPTVSENGTSTVIHELVHVATGWQADEGDDWLVEGLAEFYSLELLRRSGGISDSRFRRSVAALGQWAVREEALLSDPSKGASTALAVVVFDRLNNELDGGLDDWVKQVPRGSDVSCTMLADYARTRGVTFSACDDRGRATLQELKREG